MDKQCLVCTKPAVSLTLASLTLDDFCPLCLAIFARIYYAACEYSQKQNHTQQQRESLGQAIIDLASDYSTTSVLTGSRN